MVVPNTPIVRSRSEIIKGLLTRAFAKSQEEGERMELLIEWRLAACRHANRKAIRNFSHDFKLEDYGQLGSTGSRALDAFNWLAVIDGRGERLADEYLEARIKEMEKRHYISRRFKSSEIKVDVKALKRAALTSNPKSPIIFEISHTQPGQRNADEVVYLKSYATPAFMSQTLDQIDSWVDEFEATAQTDDPFARRQSFAKKPAHITMMPISKSKFGPN